MAEFAGALGGWEELFSTPLTAKVPSLGVNYMEASKPEVAVGLPHHGRDLCFVQRLDEHGIGGIVWDCGAAAAALLDAYPALVAGRRVVDLGCGGSGVAGLAAAACGAASTTLTDVEELRGLVEANVARNARAFATAAVEPGAATRMAATATPRFASFTWGSPATSAESLLTGCAGGEGRGGVGGAGGAGAGAGGAGGTPPIPPAAKTFYYDTVLCADCVYDGASVAPLLEAIGAVSGPGTLLIMAHKRRIDERERPFFEHLSAAGWHIEIVPRRCFATTPGGGGSSGDGGSSSGGDNDNKPPDRSADGIPRKVVSLTDVHLLIAMCCGVGDGGEEAMQHWRRTLQIAD